MENRDKNRTMALSQGYNVGLDGWNHFRLLSKRFLLDRRNVLEDKKTVNGSCYEDIYDIDLFECAIIAFVVAKFL